MLSLAGLLGPEAELYVDANGGYSTGQAIRVADELSAVDVSWFEEPVSSQDPAGLAAVRRQVRPDVAAGEYSWSLADSARLIEAGAVDCLQLDVTRCGGITEFIRGAALAAAHNLQVSGHCAPNLHAHVGAAVPNLRHARSVTGAADACQCSPVVQGRTASVRGNDLSTRQPVGCEEHHITSRLFASGRAHPTRP